MARPPILLIHGAFANGRHFAGWAGFFSRAGFECHAPSLPGHGGNDPSALAFLGLDDYLAALKREIGKLALPPVLIGHSMGGLLAQQLAASVPCRALVCVASAPPWAVVPQMRALPFFLPTIPAMLSGRALRVSDETVRELALHDLPEDEQSSLLPTFGAESGRAYRAMILGLARLPGKPFSGPVLCVSGDADRLIPRRTATAIARLYRARHAVFRGRGHWLIGASAEQEVAGRVLRWLEDVLGAAGR
jgi:pimeloyl-ACP methyl ester carboxylesterase